MSYDPDRLTALARIRDEKRALARSANDRYQDERERLTDARRRAQLARLSAEAAHPAHAAEGHAQADRLDAECEAIRVRMTALQVEIDVLAEEASEAARLTTACLSFAVTERLEIPAPLRAEAQHVDYMGAR